MKIYEYRGFPNPTRVRIALAEKGLTERVTFVQVDVLAGENRTPGFLRKNPSGGVPVLELADETTIAECTAITEYLDHLDGRPVLTGQAPKERAMVHMMQRRAEAGLLDAVALYYHHATPGFGPELETYQNPGWGEHSRERALDGMRYMDGVLRERPYLAGERFSMADITAFAGLAYADFAQIEIPPALDALQEWRARIAQRPAVAAA